jgi:hypothetical protein
MTSDYLFKFLLQSDQDVLQALVCAYLDIAWDEIRNIHVINTISLADDPQKKEMILDVKAEMNDDTIINLEMQVINNHDWPERSISYLCRCFDNLQSGQAYHPSRAPSTSAFWTTRSSRNTRSSIPGTASKMSEPASFTLVNFRFLW